MLEGHASNADGYSFFKAQKKMKTEIGNG